MKQDKQQKQTGRTLAVDKEFSNRALLKQVFEKFDSECHCVSHGKEFLKVIHEDANWDMFIIDMILPDISGVKLLERIRDHATLLATPVLVVTDSSSEKDRLQCVQLGANEFVAKPFDLEELAFRISENLKLGVSQRPLRESLDHMKKREKLSSDLLLMVLHDLRGPLMGLFSKLNLLMLRLSEGHLPEDLLKKELAAAKSLVNILESISSSIIDVERLKTANLPLNIRISDVKGIVDSALDSLNGLLESHKWTLEIADDVTELTCDPEIIRRVLINFFSNAIKYSKNGTTITVSVLSNNEGQVEFRIASEGKGIPRDSQAQIFDRFYSLEPRKPTSSSLKNKRYSTGLGLTFCKLAIESHGGKVGVDSNNRSGNCFWFSLPKS